MKQEVIEYIEKVKESRQTGQCHEWRQVVHNAIPDVQECMPYNCRFETLALTA